MNAIEFFVTGEPKPAGSKKAFPLWRGSGPNRQFVRSIITDDSGPAGKSWRALVQDRARGQVDASAGLIECPLFVSMTFYVLRPKSHYGAKGLLSKAPKYPAKKPDVLKLARAVEDALTGVIWRDDCQIVTEAILKRYGEAPGVAVVIREQEMEAHQ